MKRVTLPNPPNPDDYQSPPAAYNRAMFVWATQIKGILEQASQANDTPLDQSFLVGTGYTLTTSVSGTSTGTDMANFVCSLVNAMTKKGLISPVILSRH